MNAIREEIGTRRNAAGAEPRQAGAVQEEDRARLSGDPVDLYIRQTVASSCVHAA
jgi:hypothetical protein